MSAENEINSSQTEESLVAGAKEGDQYAFELLADSYKRILDLYIKKFSPPADVYDDLFQEGLIGLLKAVRSYDGVSASFATFASLCIKNNIISAIRKYNRHPTEPLVTDVVTDPAVPSPEDALLDDVRSVILYKKVKEALSPYEQTVLDLYLSDLSYKSIAFATGKSVKSTENAVYRIRNKLRSVVFD